MSDFDGSFGFGDFSPPTENLNVVELDPADDSVLLQAPTTLTVTFNLPIDPFSLSFDFGLDRVNADGSLIPLDPSLLSEPDGFGPASASLVLTVNQQLAPGEYKLVLLGISNIAGMTDTGDVFWSAPGGWGTDTVLGGFTIEKPGVTLADASDLGVVGPSPVAINGVLDLQADLSSVSLYKFTVAPGHFWQFGAETWASRIGSPLAATLSLFDSNGQLIRTASVGRSSAPKDPDLFAGLQPGTYYIGISGAGNVPGSADGYDPVSGKPGTGMPQVGGTFQLNLAAAPADAPTRVQGFQLQWADSLSASPTGFVLTFSAPMDLTSFVAQGNQSFGGLEVVDQNGKTWGVMPVADHEATGEFTFVFDTQLPAGDYTLRLPAQGGVTDLAGRAPVASGKSDGVLATWTVRPTTSKPQANNLGALDSRAAQGIDLSTNLSAGASVTYRMVVLAENLFNLDTNYSGGQLSIQVKGPAGSTTYDAGASNRPQDNLLTLSPGVYYLTFTASASEPLELSALFRELRRGWESWLDNGVGQGPALNLLFLDPTAPSGGGAPSPTPTPGAPTPTPSTPSPTPAPPSTGANSAAVSSAFGTPVLAAPGGLVLTLGGSLAGTLGPMAGQTASASMLATPATGALAEGNSPPAQPIVVSPGESLSGSFTEGPTGESDPTVMDLASNGALTEELLPVEDGVDARVVAETEWIGRVGQRLAYWFALAPESVPDPVVPPEPVAAPSPERVALQRDDLPATEPEKVDRADLSMPLGLGLISILTLRFQRPVRRWWRERTKRSEVNVPMHQGPHRKI